MSRSQTCPICWITVAPFAGDRIEFKGQAAHEGCVRRRFKQVHEGVDRLLIELSEHDLARYFREKAPRASRPVQMAHLVEHVLGKAYATLVNGRGSQRGTVAETADRMSDLLMCQIVIVVDASARPAPKAPPAVRSAT